MTFFQGEPVVPRRAFLSAAALTISTTALAACSSGAAATAPSTSTSSTAASLQTAAVKSQPATISFSRRQVTPLRIKMSVYDPIARFEKAHPGTKVAADIIPIPTYTTKLLTMIAGGVAPDVISLPGPFGILPLFAQKKAIADLSPLIARDAAVVHPSDFLSQALTVGQWQGKQYGLLISPLSTAVLVYNADSLRRAGIDQTPAQMYDAGKWTWDDVATVAQQATLRASSGGPARQFGFAVSFAAQQAISYVWEAGGHLLNKERTKALIDGAGAIAGFQYLFDLLHKFRVSPTSADLQSESMANLMNTGQSCLSFSWAHTVGANLAQVKFNWDIVPLPVGKDGEIVNNNYNNVGLSSTSKHREIAWEFIEYMTSGAEYLAEQHQAIPARKSVYQAWLKWMEQSPRPKNLKYLSMLAEKSRSLPYSPAWPQINNAWNKGTSYLEDGSKEPGETARALASAIDAVLR
ncbi:MAG: sugar ABC transporter substrate-binding protein [Chloroflexi bacterium]|nr:sugar ABC transporter substrate-binding protein [Chloroflexota bacterium]